MCRTAGYPAITIFFFKKTIQIEFQVSRDVRHFFFFFFGFSFCLQFALRIDKARFHWSSVSSIPSSKCRPLRGLPLPERRRRRRRRSERRRARSPPWRRSLDPLRYRFPPTVSRSRALVSTQLVLRLSSPDLIT